MRELIFAMGYQPHRLWGNILQAQFLEKREGNEFYSPLEYIQNDPSTQAFGRLTPMQRELVRLVDQYSDRSLHRSFSKKKTAKEFMDTVEEKTIHDHIRPYIEKRLYQALEIARENRIRLFLKDKSDRNIFPEDFIRIEKFPVDPVFCFDYSDGLFYSLRLIHGENHLVLHTGAVEIVTHRPTVIILGDTLFFVNDIDGKKLIPFLKKEKVMIPPSLEQKYFSTFVRNTLRDFNALTSGFAVNELTIPGKAELFLEVGMRNMPVWILRFHYGRHTVFPDSPLKRFVDYKGTGGKHVFERYSRDDVWEEQMEATLREVGLGSRDGRNFILNEKFKRDDVDDLYSAINFTNDISPVLADAGIDLKHRLQRDYYLDRIELLLESQEQQEWFNVNATVRLGDTEVKFLSLRNHILHGIREYELPGGKVVVLPLEWFARYHSMFEFGQIDEERIRIHKQHFSMVEDTIRDFHADTLARLEKLIEVKHLPSFTLPGGLNVRLREYQIEGYKWFCFLQQNGFGGCLADDMGLGKTLQAIAVLLKAKDNPVVGTEVADSQGGQLSLFARQETGPTSLVVVPASLLHNWVNECSRFAPGLTIYPYVGVQRDRDISNLKHYDLVISTYHTVRQDIDQLASFPFHYVVLDESQMIKNASSKVYQAVIELQSDHRIVLTGTPIENSLMDLWSQINFVNPGLLGTLNFFKRSFVVPIEKKKDEQREEHLKELISPFILRRTKQEVARELPPVYEQVRFCNMTDAQRRFYEEEKSIARYSILENIEAMGLEKSSFVVLKALTRLRQIANHPAMVEDSNGMESGKFIEVCRDIESVVSEGHKILIFSSFVKHLDLFRKKLEEDGTRYAYLTGSSKREGRARAVSEFQGDSNCRIFLISLKAGGVGLNLTAADYVFILDPWWNPAAEIQAMNRAHRIGQENNVFVYRFISMGTIEEKIQKLQDRKKELAASFITSNNPLRDLSEKELMDLFK